MQLVTTALFHPKSSQSSSGSTDFVEALERTKAQGQALRPASYADEARDWSILAFLLDAQVG